MGQAGATRVCANCGTVNSASDQFCSNCGYSLLSGPPDKTTLSSPIAPTVSAVPPVGVATNRRVTGAFQTGNVLGGRYRVVQLIGKGGFGAVYKATDERFQSRRVVAVKEMSDAQLSAKEKATAIQNFRNEADLLVGLSHPNLPNVSDFFEEDGKAYLVMEFVEGQTLEDVQKDAGGPLPEPLVMEWALQLCGVLHYLHTRPQPIIFRDMKPGNVMVTAEGQIKLIDFGIARIFKSAGTKDTTLLGSQGYAPLEQYGRGQSDARSDIYALGATLYDLLTNEVPADAPTRRVHPQAFETPRQLNPTITAATEAIVLKAMADEPQNRYQSAADMYQAIVDANVAAPSGTVYVRGGSTATHMATLPPRSGLPTTPKTLVPPNTGNTVANSAAASAANPARPPVMPPPPAQRPPVNPAPTPSQGGISRRAVLAGGLVVGAAVVGGSVFLFSRGKGGSTGTQPVADAINVMLTYSTEKQDWLQQAIIDFNNSGAKIGNKPIQVVGDAQGSVDAKQKILDGTLKPVAWSPASLLEINLLNYAWNQKHGKDLTFTSGDLMATPLVFSPLVFAMWKQRAALFLQKYGSVDWEHIHSAVALQSWSDLGGDSSWGPVKLGQTRPDQSNSGLLSITLLAYSYYHISRGLTVAQIQDTKFLQYFQDIQGAVQAFGRSSGTFLKKEVITKGPADYDIVTTYENLILTNEKDAQRLNHQTLQAFYPSPNIVSDHPFAILNADWVTPEEQQAAKAFRDFLLSDDRQRKALLTGFRPTSPNVMINDSIAGNPFKGQTSDITIPQSITNQAQAPSGNVVNELLSQWGHYYNGAPTALSDTSNGTKGQEKNGNSLL